MPAWSDTPSDKGQKMTRGGGLFPLTSRDRASWTWSSLSTSSVYQIKFIDFR